MPDTTETSLPQLLDDAPMGLLLLNRQDQIISANKVATQAGLLPGTTMAMYVTDLQERFCEAIRYEPPTKLWLFSLEAREKKYTVAWSDSPEGVYVWLQDLSEQLALAEKVRQFREPESKKLRQINHQAVTAMGYAELLEVIMEDHEILTTENLSTVRRYQDEVRASLQNILGFSDAGREPHRPASSSILVAEGHVALSELITELLRAEGYRVTGFSDAASAFEFYQVNSHSIHKALIDDTLKHTNGQPLISTLRSLAPELNIVVLTDDAEASIDSIQKPVDFHRLLKAMED